MRAGDMLGGVLTRYSPVTRCAFGIRHSAFGIRHSALGIGHWALGIGHWALRTSTSYSRLGHTGTAAGLFVPILLLAALPVSVAAAQSELTIDAPMSLRRAADRVRAVDLSRLARDLHRAGLDLPARMNVTMIPEDDPRASDIPRWIVGLALAQRDVVIFPERVLPYPYDSVESVFRTKWHISRSPSAQAASRCHAGFRKALRCRSMGGWRVSGQLRLILEMLRNPGTSDLSRLFAANTEPEADQAYGLSAALVADLQRRHGSGMPGSVAARVARGVSFASAFEMETGETPDHAATRAWAAYRRWTVWVPALTDGTAAWVAILGLATAAYIARRRRRARRRRLWDEEDLAIRDAEE